LNLTYEYRLFTRKAEARALEVLLEQSREVYNAALAQAKMAWATEQVHVGGLSQWSYFREWRKQPGILLNASSLQHTLRRLDKAYSAFFRRIQAGETPGHPRIKPQQRFNSIEYTYGDRCKLVYDETYDRINLYIQNVGEVKIKWHRFFWHDADAIIKHVVIKRKNRRWYVYLMVEVPDIEFVPNGKPPVGGDMGLLRLLSLSDESLLDNPRWMRQELAHLRVAQRQLSRRRKGGQRRKQAAYRVARIHEHVTNQRRDFWHQLTFWLVKTYGLIALEDLELKFMLVNHKLSLSAHDAGLGMFQRVLPYKAAKAGAEVALVNPAYTSQMCSSCGCVVKKDLSERVHRCPECHLVLDRDVNAARNILSLALQSAGTPPSGANVDR
jgi:putative transposase